MGGLGCSTVNSCHPFLLVFGLIYVGLFVALVMLPTIFDRADWSRRQRGPVLASLRPRTPKRAADPEAATDFRAIRYEDTESVRHVEATGATVIAT